MQEFGKELCWRSLAEPGAADSLKVARGRVTAAPLFWVLTVGDLVGINALVRAVDCNLSSHSVPGPACIPTWH